MRCRFCTLICFAGATWLLSFPAPLQAEKPTVEFALQLAPIQADVEFDKPTPEEAKQCLIEAENGEAVTSWVVRSASGQILRSFQDTNSDNKVDRWCYFKNGIEVYRDIDGNQNGKADQYRWLGTAGTRWGLDTNEDGQVDAWKVISPEEVAAEVVAAVRQRDAHRFSCLLISAGELESVGLSAARTEEIQRRLRQAEADFESLARKQTAIGPKAEFVFFGGGRPGVIPTGTDGATKDIYLYDNVAAVIGDESQQHQQLSIGALVRVNETWRLIDLPSGLVEGDVPGPFFQVSLAGRPNPPAASQADENLQKLIADLDAVDRQLSAADGPAAARLHARRAELLDGIVAACKTEEERAIWIRQLADTVSAAIQSGAFPAGRQRLEKLLVELGNQPTDANLLAYVRYRQMTAEYGLELQDPKADYAKIQEHWLEQLNGFVRAYPTSPDAAEAMLQIAMAEEFAGKESDAITWYTRIAKDFADSDAAPKALGAKQRLECVGKNITVKGKLVDGRPFDLASLRGKPVVVHYWATWCEPCKEDMQVLRRIQDKYQRGGLTIVGINLDTDGDALKAYFASQPPAWIHLQESDGLDGRLATEMGILTLPTMLLLDKNGRVVHRQLHGGQLEAEIEKVLR
jgi:thiol-disulfide isomerase/thioredoxin